MTPESPKTRFLKTEDCKVHAESCPKMQGWLEIALLELNNKLGFSPTIGDAAATQYRSEGAREFVRIFLNLSSREELKPRRDPDNLHPERNLE